MKNKSSFICKNCGTKVQIKAWGTKNRNHCPNCLYSLHVDKKIGDRSSVCGGLMPPIGKVYKKDGEEVLVHKCSVCGKVRKNRIAGDDSIEGVSNLLELT